MMIKAIIKIINYDFQGRGHIKEVQFKMYFELLIGRGVRQTFQAKKTSRTRAGNGKLQHVFKE